MSTSISTRVHTFPKVLNEFRSFSACVIIEFTSQMIHLGGSHCIIILDCSMSFDRYAGDFHLKSTYQVSCGTFLCNPLYVSKKNKSCHKTLTPSPFLPPLLVHHIFHNNYNCYTSSTTTTPIATSSAMILLLV